MKKNVVWVFVLVLTVMLSACAPKATSPFSAFTKAEAAQFSLYYSETYALETQVSALFAEWVSYVDTQYAGIEDMQYLADNCYQNVEDVLVQATAGAFDGADGEVDPALLLATVSLYPGVEAEDICSEMLVSTLDQVKLVRQSGYERWFSFNEAKRTLMNKYYGDFQTSLANHLFSLYGADFLAYANDLIVGQGLKPIPSQFIGFPTDGLQVNTKSRAWYTYCRQIYDGVVNPPDERFSRQMYFCTWTGPEIGGQGTLYRQVAWEYMNRLFVSDGTSSAIDAGEAIPGLNP